MRLRGRRDGEQRTLICDKTPVIHLSAKRASTKKNGDLLFSAYSPECFNCDLKAGVHFKPPARDGEKLEKKIRSHMKKLQGTSERVRKYFKHHKIPYAAWYAQYFIARSIMTCGEAPASLESKG